MLTIPEYFLQFAHVRQAIADQNSAPQEDEGTLKDALQSEIDAKMVDL